MHSPSRDRSRAPSASEHRYRSRSHSRSPSHPHPHPTRLTLSPRHFSCTCYDGTTADCYASRRFRFAISACKRKMSSSCACRTTPKRFCVPFSCIAWLPSAVRALPGGQKAAHRIICARPENRSAAAWSPASTAASVKRISARAEWNAI